MTYYYEVAPSGNKYHGSTLLSYQCDEISEVGRIVEVELRGQKMLGFIVRQVKKPTFLTKSLEAKELNLPIASVQLFLWMESYYPGSIGALAHHFLPQLLLKNLQNPQNSSQKTITKQIQNASSETLTKEQQDVVKKITDKSEQTFLLHGETGSGKTRVYTELANTVLDAGRSAIILTPEISLTPQLMNSFRVIFGNRVMLIHSGLTVAERRKVWLDLLMTKEPRVIIGPRSALFVPIYNLGLIVIDEFHDAAYKQDSAPYYHAVRVASTLAKLHGAKLVLGSATPPINEYYLAEKKKIPILRMTTRAKKFSKENDQSEIRVVDLTHPSEKTNHALLSATLLKEIQTSLSQKEQSILFLNKRGSARAIVCQVCGWQSTCPNCDLPLTYHQDDHLLRCHTCGFTDKIPAMCPSCHSSEILFKNPGTKAIANALQHIFPEATVARFDRDNKKVERIEARHTDILDGTIDILVGTQLLTKGHDLPRLGFVGILLAESGLDFPDYTAEERSYQTIRQLMGRVNRGHRPGRIVVQTFDPNNSTLTEAIGGKWSDFYYEQLKERAAFGFPPFFHVMKVELSRSSRSSAKASALKVIDTILAMNHKIMVIGPTPSFLEKRANKWHWQFVVKSKNRSELVSITKSLGSNCQVNLDPNNLL